jgi:hypothetical protein
MVTSSAASERNISTIGFKHSKQRNLLAPRTVEKLVYIKSNMPMFCDCPVMTSSSTTAALTARRTSQGPIRRRLKS